MQHCDDHFSIPRHLSSSSSFSLRSIISPEGFTIWILVEKKYYFMTIEQVEVEYNKMKFTVFARLCAVFFLLQFENLPYRRKVENILNRNNISRNEQFFFTFRFFTFSLSLIKSKRNLSTNWRLSKDIMSSPTATSRQHEPVKRKPTKLIALSSASHSIGDPEVTKWYVIKFF